LRPGPALTARAASNAPTVRHGSRPGIGSTSNASSASAKPCRNGDGERRGMCHPTTDHPPVHPIAGAPLKEDRRRCGILSCVGDIPWIFGHQEMHSCQDRNGERGKYPLLWQGSVPDTMSDDINVPSLWRDRWLPSPCDTKTEQATRMREDCHSHSLLLLAMKRSAVELREDQRPSVHLLTGSSQKAHGIWWRRNMTRRTKGKRTHRTCDCCGREIFSYQDTVYGDRRTYHYECWKPPITNDTCR